MAEFYGTTGDDVLNGTPNADVMAGGLGNDVMNGGDGNDDMSSGDGNDQMFGEGGDDILRVSSNTFGSPTLRFTVTADGGTGNDHFQWTTYNIASILIGGDGNDRFTLNIQGGGNVNINAGTGDDRIEIEQASTGNVTLGSGADTIHFNGSFQFFNSVFSWTISDFNAAEDRITGLAALVGNVGAGPFVNGNIRLVQDGADTLVQVDRDGSGSTYAWTTYLRLQNVVASSVIQIDGWLTDGSGKLTYGTPGDDLLMAVSVGNDIMYGGDGNDRIQAGGFNQGNERLYGEGGNDQLSISGGSSEMWGGEGNDYLYTTLSTGFASTDTVLFDGGNGDDYILFGNAASSSGGRGPMAIVRGGDGNDDIILQGSNTATVNAGAGNDVVTIGGHAGIGQANFSGITGLPYTITLGTGADVVQLAGDGYNSNDFSNGPRVRAVHVITDFDPAVDRLVLDDYDYFYQSVPGTPVLGDRNPFAFGFMRLIQSGNDTILQTDNTGGGDNWVDAIRFQNVQATAFTEISGYRVDGTATVGYVVTDSNGSTGSLNWGPLFGGGGNDVLTGGVGRDVIDGFAGDDVIHGGDDNDLIYGGRGVNRLYGDGGNDTVTGSGTDDEIYGGAGNDSLGYTAAAIWTVGNSIPTNAYGSASDHVLMDGGEGDDNLSIAATRASGTLFGRDGNDIISGNGFGHVIIDGGIGNDTITVTANTGVITLGAGADKVFFDAIPSFHPSPSRSYTLTDYQEGVDQITINIAKYLNDFGTGAWDGSNPFATGHFALVQDGADAVLRRDVDGSAGASAAVNFLRFQNTSVGALTAASFMGFSPDGSVPAGQTISGTGRIDGGAGGDTLTGTGSAQVYGGYGNDRLITGGTLNTLFGGLGNDTFVISHINNTVAENMNEGNDTVELAINIANYTVPAWIENLVYTGPGNASLQGNFDNNTITAGGGDDTFNLSQGGNDTANGGAGNDAFFFGNALTAADTVNGGEGANDQIGLQGNYTGANALTLGTNTISGIELIGLMAGAGNSYSITTVNANVAAGGVLTLFGTNLKAGNNFTFDGSAETDGQFRVYGGAGTDVVTGGGGNDGFWFGPGRFDPTVDRVNGGGGTNDQLALDGDYTITLNGTTVQGIETITLMAGPAGDRNDFDITVANSLIGAGQQLTIWAVPVVTAIRIDASAELDGSVRVFGGHAGDSIYGSAGDDRLFGGDGGDFLYGGAGNDTYVYDAVSQSTGINCDGIQLLAGDKIDFNFTVGGIAATVTTGALTGDFDADLTAAIGAGQLGVGEAALFRPDAGVYAGNSFLIVDANGVAGYQAGQDYVIQLIGNPATLPPDPFV